MDLLKALLDAISPPDKKSFIINNLQNEGGLDAETPQQAAQRLYYQQLRKNATQLLTSEVTGPPSEQDVSQALAGGQPSLVSSKPLFSTFAENVGNTFNPQNENDFVGAATWGPASGVYPKFVKPSRWMSKTFQTQLAKAMINDLPNLPPEKVPETASKIKTFIDWMGKASDKKLVAKQLFEDLDPATRKLVFDTMEKVSPYSGVVKGGRETFWQELKARNAKNPPERINELRKNFLEAKEKKYRLSPDEQEELLKLGGLGSSSVVPLQPSVPTTGDDLADILLRSLKNLRK